MSQGYVLVMSLLDEADLNLACVLATVAKSLSDDKAAGELVELAKAEVQ